MRIQLGPLAISPHGIFTVLGFLVGARLLLADARRRGSWRSVGAGGTCPVMQPPGAPAAAPQDGDDVTVQR